MTPILLIDYLKIQMTSDDSENTLLISVHDNEKCGCIVSEYEQTRPSYRQVNTNRNSDKSLLLCCDGRDKVNGMRAPWPFLV